MKFNEKLQKLRKEKGLSQKDLAELVNVSRQAVAKALVRWNVRNSIPYKLEHFKFILNIKTGISQNIHREIPVLFLLIKVKSKDFLQYLFLQQPLYYIYLYYN